VAGGGHELKLIYFNLGEQTGSVLIYPRASRPAFTPDTISAICDRIAGVFAGLEEDNRASGPPMQANRNAHWHDGAGDSIVRGGRGAVHQSPALMSELFVDDAAYSTSLQGQRPPGRALRRTLAVLSKSAHTSTTTSSARAS
jgi:hypothetical protein